MIEAIPALDEVPADFHERYVVARRPVVVRGGARDWPAVGKWSPSHLRQVAGAHPVAVSGPDSAIEVRLGDYLDGVEAGAARGTLRSVFLHFDLPELSADVGRLSWAQPNWFEKEPFASLVRAARPRWLTWCELFVSQPGTRFPFVHVARHMTHAWWVQIHGEQRHWAWAPRPGFEPTPCVDRDLMTLFDTSPVTGVVAPGDALFLPAGWPHTAESVTTSIGTSGNFVNDSNWGEFSRDLCEGELRQLLLAHSR